MIDYIQSLQWNTLDFWVQVIGWTAVGLMALLFIAVVVFPWHNGKLYIFKRPPKDADDASPHN